MLNAWTPSVNWSLIFANLDRALMGRFRWFLDDFEVKEIPFLGRKYTWSNERSSTPVRLDRAFCCSEWEDIFPDAVLQSTASVVSDHCPLILGLKVSTNGKRCFHFGSFWTKIPGFLDAVQQNWNAPVASSLTAACHAPCQSPGFFLCGWCCDVSETILHWSSDHQTHPWLFWARLWSPNKFGKKFSFSYSLFWNWFATHFRNSVMPGQGFPMHLSRPS